MKFPRLVVSPLGGKCELRDVIYSFACWLVRVQFTLFHIA